MNPIDNLHGGIVDAVRQASPDVLSAIYFLGDDLNTVVSTIKAMSWLLGILVTMAAIRRLAMMGNTGGGSINGEIGWGSVVTMFVVGVLLFNLPATIDSMSFTAFGGTGNALAYTQLPDMAAKWSNALHVIFLWIGCCGYFSVVWGLLDIKHVSEGLRRGTIWKGFWHIVGGWAAIHLDDVLNALKLSIST